MLALVEIVLKIAGRPDRVHGGEVDGPQGRIPLSSEDWMFWAEWVVLGVAAFIFAYISRTLKNEAVPLGQLWTGLICIFAGLFLLPVAVRYVGYGKDGKTRRLSILGRQVPVEIWSGAAALLLLIGAVSSGVQVYGI